MLLAGRRCAARSPAAAAWGGLRAYPSPRKSPIIAHYRQKSRAKFLFYKDLCVSAPPGGSGLAEPIHRVLSGRGAGPDEPPPAPPHAGEPHVSGTFGGYFVRDTCRTIGLLTTGLLLRDQAGELCPVRGIMSRRLELVHDVGGSADW